MPDPGSLLERFRRGDRLALARLLSLVARGENLQDVMAALPATTRPSRTVAITGGGGVGKSTLVGKLIDVLRKHGQTVAVLACDPQSPLSGGALLGDRFRMAARTGDDGVFIRSLAAPSHHGAIAEHLVVMVRVLEAFGFDVILIETVGAGQGDTAVRDLADVVVLLLQPETGDDLQWEKAGVLEVADVLVIHKADLPGAEQVEAQVRGALGLGKENTPPIVKVSSRTEQGLQALWEAVRACPLRRATEAAHGRELLRLAQEHLAAQFARDSAAADRDLQQIVAAWQQGKLNEDQAISALCKHLETTFRAQS
jgi:LAO/AO transport system ATPase